MDMGFREGFNLNYVCGDEVPCFWEKQKNTCFMFTERGKKNSNTFRIFSKDTLAQLKLIISINPRSCEENDLGPSYREGLKYSKSIIKIEK